MDTGNKNAMKNNEGRKVIVISIALGIMIILQILVVSYFVVFEKESYHSDEPWSYGLANSFYKPFLFGDTHVGYCQASASAWLTGEDLTDYLTVQKGERFRFDSVWYNQALDVHPPLWYCLLHGISSLFPDSFSNAYAYVINIAAMIIGQIFLFKSAKRLCRSEVTALAVCALWGFSAGFINVNCYLRMYSTLTMFAVILFYCHVRLYRSEGSFKANLIKTGAVTLLGALTHHYFLAYAFIMAACFCFYFLFSKKFTEMFRYAYTMIISVMISLAVFPSTFVHMFGDDVLSHGTIFKMPLINGLRACLSITVNSLFGGIIDVWSTGRYAYVVVILVFVAALLIPIGVLCRKEEWFRIAAAKVKSGFLHVVKNFDFMLLIIVISSVFCMIAVALSVNINTMLFYTDRYLFFIMPQIALGTVLLAEHLLSVIPVIKKYAPCVLALAVCVSAVFSNIRCEKRYLFPAEITGKGGIKSTCDENSSYILLSGYPWQMVCYADKLMGCNEVYVTSVYKYKESFDEFKKLDRSGKCYIIIDSDELAKSDKMKDVKDGKVTKEDNQSMIIEDGDSENYVYNKIPTEEDVIESFETEIFPGSEMTLYGTETVFGGEVHIYELT